MSINSLANAAAARRADFAPIGTVPKGLAEIADASAYIHAALAASPLAAAAAPAAAAPAGAAAAPAAAAPAGPAPASPAAAANGVNTALHVIFGYIPTEILTLYVAVLAALEQPGPVTKPEWIPFFTFLIATPVVVWLLYAAKVKAAQKPVPASPSQWPVWEMFAATVAYSAWAFALPNSPFTSYHWYSSAIAAIIVLLASTALGLLAPFFQRPINQ